MTNVQPVTQASAGQWTAAPFWKTSEIKKQVEAGRAQLLNPNFTVRRSKLIIMSKLIIIKLIIIKAKGLEAFSEAPRDYISFSFVCLATT